MRRSLLPEYTTSLSLSAACATGDDARIKITLHKQTTSGIHREWGGRLGAGPDGLLNRFIIFNLFLFVMGQAVG